MSKRKKPGHSPELPVAFTCRACGRPYTQDYYQGPHPHSPPSLCYDCWCNHWWAVPPWASHERVEMLLWLVAIGGYTKAEASKIVGIHPTTASRWIRAIRDNPDRLRQVLSDSR